MNSARTPAVPMEHRCFTVSGTAYLRNLTREDAANAIAVHYQKPPRKTENGTSYGLNFPLLIVAGYVEDQQGVAERVARILNAHWEDAE